MSRPQFLADHDLDEHIDVNTMIKHASERLAVGQPMPGLFMLRQKEPIAPAIESLVMIWAATEAEEWNGIIQFLPL